MLFRNIVSHYLGYAVAGIANFLLIPLLVNRLGQEDYGILALCFSAVALLQLLEFGVSEAVVKYVAEWKARGDTLRMQRFYGTGMLLFVVLGVVAASVLAMLAFRIPEWFHVATSNVAHARKAIFLSAAGLLFAFPCMHLKGYLVGGQRFDLSNSAEALSLLFYTASAAVLVLTGHGLASVAMAYALSYVARLLLMLTFVWRKFPDLRRVPMRFHVSLLKELREFSFWNFIRNVASRISWDVDTIVIAAFLSAKSVTVYVLGCKLPFIYSALSWRWVEVFFPLSSELNADGETENIRGLFIRVTRWSIALSVAAGMILILLAEPLLVLWLGQVNRETVIVQQLVTVSVLFDLSHSVSATLLSGIGRLKRVSQILLMEAILNLTLSIILVRSLGIVGVALATVISSFIFVLFLQIPYSCRVFQVSASMYFREIWVPQMLPTVVTGTLLLSFVNYEAAVAPVIGVLAVSLYAGIFWFHSISLKERETIRSLIRFQKTKNG